MPASVSGSPILSVAYTPGLGESIRLEGVKAMAEMGMFLGILSIGLLYGWREGIFRWQ